MKGAFGDEGALRFLTQQLNLTVNSNGKGGGATRAFGPSNNCLKTPGKFVGLFPEC
jgi:hypothetical protein